MKGFYVMQVYFDELPVIEKTVVAIGAFDGVHKGHQAVLQLLKHYGKEHNVPSFVYTFSPPPRSYFQNAKILTPINEKLKRIHNLGIDHCFVANFNQDYVNRSAYSFIEELSMLNPQKVVVGKDFRFGKDRKGDISLLSKYFNVQTVEPICCSSGRVISSSRIRELIYKGETEKADLLLGW
jgi:riboflavin kinase/FMN adenylyltransferase